MQSPRVAEPVEGGVTGWLTSVLFGLLLHSFAARPVPPGVGVTASCTDFVRVADAVFTGRTGAWFGAHGGRDYLGGETFGPRALSIGGVDPAACLARHCTRSGPGNAAAHFAAERAPELRAVHPARG